MTLWLLEKTFCIFLSLKSGWSRERNIGSLKFKDCMHHSVRQFGTPTLLLSLFTFYLVALSLSNFFPHFQLLSDHSTSLTSVLIIYCYGKTSDHSDRGISRINHLLSSLPTSYQFVIVNDEEYSNLSCDSLLENIGKKDIVSCYNSDWDFLQRQYGGLMLRCFDLVTLPRKATALAVLDVMRSYLSPSLRFVWRLEDDALYTGKFDTFSDYYLQKYPDMDLITKYGQNKEVYAVGRGKGLCNIAMQGELQHATDVDQCAETCFQTHHGTHIGSCGWKKCKDIPNCACFRECPNVDESEKMYDLYELVPVHDTTGKHWCWSEANLHRFGAVRNFTSLQFMAGYSPRIIKYALEMIERGAFAHYEIFWPSLTVLSGGQWVGFDEHHHGHPFGFRPRDHSINPNEPDKLYHPMKKEYAFLPDGTGILRESEGIS